MGENYKLIRHVCSHHMHEYFDMYGLTYGIRMSAKQKSSLVPTFVLN